MKEIPVSKEVLFDLYWQKNLKPREIAKLFGIKNERTIRKKMERYGIKRKTVSEALTKKLKNPFTGNLQEKAFLIGLRAGDFHGKRVKKCIRMQTSTTHLAQIELLKNAFQNYGQICTYHSKPREKQDEWFIYVDLHPSFDFLLEKPSTISQWILNDTLSFFHFLAAYIDCEGNWHISKSHEKNLRFTFRLRTSDMQILELIKQKLEDLNYTPLLNIEHEKGTKLGYGTYTNDFYGLVLNRKVEVIKLIQTLIPLSKHSEKIRKMDFILENRNRDFNVALSNWDELKKEIKKEILGSEK